MYTTNKRVISAFAALVMAFVLVVPLSGGASAATETEPNDTIQTASPISLGTETTAKLDGSDTADCFVFTLPANGSLSITYGFPMTFPWHKLSLFSLDLEGNRVSTGSWDLDDSLSYPYATPRIRVPAGTYYLEVAPLNTAANRQLNYTLTVNFTDESSGSYELEPNNTMNTATPIALNQPMTGGLLAGEESDYYFFSLDSAQEVTVRYEFLSGVPNHVLTLIQVGQANTKWTLNDAVSYPFSHTLSLSAGKYYLHVSRLVGGAIVNDTDDYVLSVSSGSAPTPTPTPDPEPQPTLNLDGASSWAHEELSRAYELSLVPAEMFTDYAGSVTRVDFCRMAVTTLMAQSGFAGDEDAFAAAMGIDLSAEPFSDTGDRYVKMAYALKIVNGTGEGRFTPDGYISRQDAAAMLTRSAAALNFTEYSGTPIAFSDMDTVADYAKEAVDFVSACGIMSGVGADSFAPTSFYSREQAIVTMYRLYSAFPAN